MNRKQRRVLGRSGRAAAAPSSSAKASADLTLAEMFGVAVAQHRGGAIADAVRGYGQILARFPDHAETHGMLGVALATQGRIGEAIPHFERTVALKPAEPGPYDDLGRAYLAAGKPELAIQIACRALELAETERRRAFFASCAKSIVFRAQDDRLRGLLRRALVEAWARPRELTRVCISLVVLNPPIKVAIARAEQAWPARLSEAELFGQSGMATLARDELLCRLLDSDPATDLGLERLLTNVRLAMLMQVSSGSENAALLDFYCDLARQCFINEYVFPATDSEARLAQELWNSLEQLSEAGAQCSPHVLATVAAYIPLHTLTNAELLLERSWPKSVEALLIQQIREPAEERRLARVIPVLTEIHDEVSRTVRQQYEESPYPRWANAGPPGMPPALYDRQRERKLEVLIAGCGTGLSTIEFARSVSNACVLAIDLSLASLSFAKRMTQKFDLANVEFAQADILQIGSLEQRFDFIDASGVLHHLADPWQGWQILLSLLRPGGSMGVGLYSELARRNVIAGRSLISQRGYQPVPADIRRCREEIAAAEDGSLLKSLTRSDDFYSLSECRDLLFHPQEHRLTLPQIKAFLAANDLQFLGFALPPAILQNFAKRFPQPGAMFDLDSWHSFECESPDTFSGMYLFSVRKPPASARDAQP